MLGNPRMSVYGASEWGAIGWSESMRIELQSRKSKVKVILPTKLFDIIFGE